MKAFEITSKTIVAIQTVGGDNRDSANLVIRRDKNTNTEVIMLADLEVSEPDGGTGILTMNASELEEIGQLFIEQSKIMKEQYRQS